VERRRRSHQRHTLKLRGIICQRPKKNRQQRPIHESSQRHQQRKKEKREEIVVGETPGRTLLFVVGGKRGNRRKEKGHRRPGCEKGTKSEETGRLVVPNRRNLALTRYLSRSEKREGGSTIFPSSTREEKKGREGEVRPSARRVLASRTRRPRLRSGEEGCAKRRDLSNGATIRENHKDGRLRGEEQSTDHRY